VRAEAPRLRTDSSADDCEQENETTFGVGATDYEDTYLDWPPRRRKAGADRGERQAGALRRLRRLSR